MRYLIAIVAVTLGIAFGSSDAASEVLVLDNATAPPWTNDDGTGFLDRIVGEAFRRCGVELKLVRLPPERGLRNANAGIEDGELIRVGGIEKIYPNLLRVPEKIADLRFTAFSRHYAVRTDSWAALRPYRIGIIKGWKIYENNLRGIVTPLLVDDAKQLFNLLGRNRVDIVLYTQWAGQAEVRERGMRDARALMPPLASVEVFTYLHKKHAALIPRLAAALRALKADGTYQREFDETIGPLTRP